MTALIVALALTQSPTVWFDRAVAAHRASPKIAVQIAVHNRTQGKGTEKITVSLRSSGKDLLYRVQAPPKPGLDRSDLTFFLHGGKVVAYDSVANEYLERKVTPGGSSVDQLESAIGQVEQAAAVLADPKRLGELFNDLEALGGWKESFGPGVRKITRSDEIKGATRVVLDSKSNKVRELSMRRPEVELQWTVTYSNPSAVSISIPKSARKVTSFRESEAPPKFESSSAKDLFDAFLGAARNVKSATVQVTEGGRSTRITFNGTSVAERSPQFAWAFNGSSLTVKAPSGRFYRGKCRQIDVIDIVGTLTGRVSPYTRNLLLRRAPFRDYFGPGDRVAVAGRITNAGLTVDILRAQNSQRRTSVLVRASDRLPESVTVDQLDGKGNSLGTSTVEFKFSKVNQNQVASDLAILVPAGVTPNGLPRVTGTGR